MNMNPQELTEKLLAEYRTQIDAYEENREITELLLAEYRKQVEGYKGLVVALETKVEILEKKNALLLYPD
jgi:phage shock protein A